jgi:carbon dioxide concentrating mechanism protein CcmN
MYLLPSPSLQNPEICVIGDVQLDPLVALAPGVVLHAEPGSQIHVAAGVCIGMGTVLHVSHGLLTIETGANLATAVLVIGNGKIGQNACVGSGATLLYPQVGVGEIIPPGSLLGDTSRQVTLTDPSTPIAATNGAVETNSVPRYVASNLYPDPWQQPEPQLEPQLEPQPEPAVAAFSVTSEIKTIKTELTAEFRATPAPSPYPESANAPNDTPSVANSLTTPTPDPAATYPNHSTANSSTVNSSTANSSTESIVPASGQNRPIYGQDYVKQMMGKMFPNHPG